MNAQEDAKTALNALQGKLGNWTAVGRHIAAKVGGNPASWTAVANAVANGKRRPTHLLLVALGLRRPRRRFSVDVPAWMTGQQEAVFRSSLRTAAGRLAEEMHRDRLD